MTNKIDVLKEDLKVFSKYLESNDLNVCNIISNRIIANSILLDSKEFTLIGCCLKNHIIYLRRVLKLEDRNDKIKEFKNYLTKVEEKIDLNVILIDYFSLNQDIIKFLIPKEEKEIYSENLEYSKHAHKFLAKFLIDELENNDSYHQINLIYGGILNELNRIIRSHGFEIEELMLQFIINYSGRLYDYFRVLILNTNRKEDWEKKWNEFKEKIINNLNKYLSDYEKYIVDSLELLFILCKEWRLMFIRLLEPFQTQRTERIPIELPKMIKDKISNLISNGINDELIDEKEEN